ncbi:MAG: hypothetical protein NVS1B11_04420 [Terriglobales bacterium]
MKTKHPLVRRAVLAGAVFGVLSTLAFAKAKDDAKPLPGESVFKARCVLCHGSDGTANTNLGKQLQARDLHDPAAQKLTDAEMKQLIGRGKGNMPPFDGQLSSTEIDQVVKYVRQFAKKR